MTNQQILEKAIQKAIDGGWSDGNAALAEVGSIPNWAIPTPVCFAIIFSHDFAKALWGEEWGYGVMRGGQDWPGCAWEYHLQEMVIAGNPIKYLEEYLDRELFKGEKQ